MESDNTTSNTRKHDNPTTTDWSHLAPMVALGAGLIAVTIFAFNERSQIDTLGQQAESHQQEIATLQSRMAAADATLSGTVGKLQDQLTDEETQTSQSIAKVQSAANRHAEAVAQNLRQNI